MDSHKRNWAVASGEGVTEESLLVSRCSLRSVVDLAYLGVGIFFASYLMPPAVHVVGNRPRAEAVELRNILNSNCSCHVLCAWCLVEKTGNRGCLVLG